MSQEKSFGIAIFGMGSDDLAVYFVDEVLWDQIISMVDDVGDFDQAQEWAGYMVTGVERPEGCPERQGAVLKEVFCQTFVVEFFSEVQGRVLGIITYPA